MSRPGEEEGDGGRQKSQSGARSHAPPVQLRGDPEDTEPGDRSREPGDRLSARSSCWSTPDPSSPGDLLSGGGRGESGLTATDPALWSAIVQKSTCADVRQNRVQRAAAVVQAARLVVAVGPLALHQEGPRHVGCQRFRCVLWSHFISSGCQTSRRWDFFMWQVITHAQRRGPVYQVSPGARPKTRVNAALSLQPVRLCR